MIKMRSKISLVPVLCTTSPIKNATIGSMVIVIWKGNGSSKTRKRKDKNSKDEHISQQNDDYLYKDSLSTLPHH